MVTLLVTLLRAAHTEQRLLMLLHITSTEMKEMYMREMMKEFKEALMKE